MKLFGRYLFVQVFALTCLTTAILSTAVWLTQSLRFIDYVMTRGLSLIMFFKLSSFLLPSLISTILPIAFLLSVVFILNKLYGDSELIVMRALGLSNGALFKPILVATTLCLALLYTINIYIQPLATKNFKDLREDIRHNLTGKWIQPGTFTSFQGVTFYIKEKTSSGRMKGIFVYDGRDPKSPVTFTAEVGQIIEKPEGLRFVLFNGSRQSSTPQKSKPNILNFDQYSVEIEQQKKLRNRHRKANELSMAELFNPDPDIGTRERKQIRVERHERLLLPLTLFPFALLACLAFFLGDYSRRGRTKRIIQACVASLAIEVAVISFLNLSDKSLWFIEMAYGIVFFVSFAAAYMLFFYQKRSLPEEGELA